MTINTLILLECMMTHETPRNANMADYNLLMIQVNCAMTFELYNPLYKLRSAIILRQALLDEAGGSGFAAKLLQPNATVAWVIVAVINVPFHS